ncbi:MAG: hypothetical protein WB866_03735, partial [Solirubrobacterales bacterium]
FSAGAAIWDGSETLDELLRRADVALYTAKTDGGSVVQVAPPTLPGDDHRTQDLRGFAQVDVAPLVEADVEVEIDDSDIRVDTYRASGAGGKL